MDGQVAVVTGAASGIGLASCVGFARLGASVRAVARSLGRADDAVREIRAQVPGADVHGLACDVSSLQELGGSPNDSGRRSRGSTCWSTTRARCPTTGSSRATAWS
jgi:NAD(P)-dependent dehydrogenase (short-subunit alcohol dehydrogenase family)